MHKIISTTVVALTLGLSGCTMNKISTSHKVLAPDNIQIQAYLHDRTVTAIDGSDIKLITYNDTQNKWCSQYISSISSTNVGEDTVDSITEIGTYCDDYKNVNDVATPLHFSHFKAYPEGSKIGVETPITKGSTDQSNNKQLASKLISIHKHEVKAGTEVTLLHYINDKDELCFQWVESAKHTDLGIEASIAVHCGEYEIRHVNNSLLGSAGEYVPIDIKAVNEHRNSDGLLVQSIEI